MEKAKKGKPFGFYVCALGFTFERLAFYTVKYLLAIWIATEVASGGLGLSDVEGAAMSGSFVAWTYITPIFGGYIADHWISPRICVPLGMILMGLGYVCTWKADSMTLVWAMIFCSTMLRNWMRHSQFSTLSLTSDHSSVQHSLLCLLQQDCSVSRQASTQYS